MFKYIKNYLPKEREGEKEMEWQVGRWFDKERQRVEFHTRKPHPKEGKFAYSKREKLGNGEKGPQS